MAQIVPHTSTVDIAWRQLREAVPGENLRRLDRLFETMAEGVVLIAPDGQIIQANAAAEAILGLMRSEIKGRACDSETCQVLTDVANRSEANKVHARLQIDSQPGDGTSLVAHVPCQV
jgi:PAS domain S-box-containing protein